VGAPHAGRVRRYTSPSMAELPHPVALIILDGFGWREEREHNAIAAASPPFWNSLVAGNPFTTLVAGGRAVGLPDDQFGNSEVGHLNLGAGRVVWQDITKIDVEIEAGRFFENPAFVDAIRATPPHRSIHLMGLVSDGGVHSVDRHYFALIDLLKRLGVAGGRVCFHAITDGRDTLPKSGLSHIERLEAKLADAGIGRIATVSGRYHAMDRDTNWARTQLYWDCITLAKGEIATTASEAVRLSYVAGVNDEFIKPVNIISHGRPPGRIESGDTVIFFNFRADRARQLCRALTEGEAFDAACFRRGAAPKVKVVTMTRYQTGLDAAVAYPQDRPKNTLGEYLSALGVKQFRCAETEKYAHVTYFFSGGVEQPFPGEERSLVPSPKVATYDLQPEMSLPEVSDRVAAALRSKQYGFVLTNFANGDMVGHTGVFEAAVAAVRAIDTALEKVVRTAREAGYSVLITADHGNCDEMQDTAGNLLTNHSYAPVPLVLLAGPGATGVKKLRDGGALRDVAPTLLALAGLPIPAEMDGTSLLA
jgi:2,3-bisphosphoglycerate-independent phosphoglycerate mutase